MNKQLLNNIQNKNAFLIMKEMQKQNIKVDAIITDPPYNVSRKNNFNTMGRQSIDFGKWDKNFNQISWIKEASKVIKPGGNILIFNDWKNMGNISKSLEKNDFVVKDLIRWIKPNPMPRNVKRRYVSDAEYIIWAVKGKNKWTFNKNEELPYHRPEFNAGVVMGKSRYHPNQKPQKIIEELIKIHTNEGDTIFDPFGGSGQISITAKKMGRQFIACEKDKTFYEKSIKRKELQNYARPIFNHLGNKYRIIEILMDKFKEQRDIEYFVDVFSGSGIVAASINNFDFPKLKEIIINDKEEIIVDILSYIKSTNINFIISDFQKNLKDFKLLTQNSINKNGYNDLKAHYNKNSKFEENEKKAISQALTLILYGFNHQIRFNSKGEFNIPPGKYISPEYIEEKIRLFKNLLDKKKVKITFEKLDFFSLFNKFDKNDDLLKTLFYFDPPYLLANETYNNIWAPEDESKLLEVLETITKKNGKWVLSNFIFAKGKENEQLVKFIEKNKKSISRKNLEHLDYSNSNYQRKKQSEDKEVIIWNWK